jgi:translation initiation factor 3 subunit L
MMCFRCCFVRAQLDRMTQRFDSQSTNPDIEADVHGDVVKFLGRLDASLASKDLVAAHRLYEVEFPQMTEQHYATYQPRGPRGEKHHQPTRHWPHLKFVKKHFTCATTELMYQIAYYRGLFADRVVSVNVRKQSWEVYQQAFTVLSGDSLDGDVPNGWLWDVIDEFIYQMQTQRMRKMRSEQLPPNTWSVSECIALLTGVVQRSKIIEILREVEAGSKPAAEVFQAGPAHAKTTLGLFALIGLVRIRVMLGDYHHALTLASPLGIHSFAPSITTKVPSAHTALYYNVGFAYLMMRRYSDATATLQQALAVKAAARKYLEALQSQVVSLLSITCTLGDMPMLDYAAFVPERHRYSQEDDLHLLAQGDVDRFRDVFVRACPKFIAPNDVMAVPGAPQESGQESKELQLRLFMREVNQQLDSLKLRGYLRAYSTITSDKIAALLTPEGTTSSAAIAPLISMKHKARQQVYASGALSSGDYKASTLIDFVVADNNVTVLRNHERQSVSTRFHDRVMALQQ